MVVEGDWDLPSAEEEVYGDSAKSRAKTACMVSVPFLLFIVLFLIEFLAMTDQSVPARIASFPASWASLIRILYAGRTITHLKSMCQC